MATIAITALAFPGDTSLSGLAALTACIGLGMLYQDAPLRRPREELPVAYGRGAAGLLGKE